MSEATDFYKNVTAWILEAAIHHPETKLSDLFYFIKKDDGLEFNVNRDLVNEWKDYKVNCCTKDLEDPKNKEAFDSYHAAEKAFYESKGIEWPRK